MRLARTPLRTMSATVASLSVLGLAGPVAGAVAATAPTAAAPPSPLLTFVPPKVGPINVYIGATIIGGKVISPGISIRMPGITMPTIAWTPLQVPSTR
jgi:hypothetical protein